MGGFYLNELLMNLLRREDPVPDVFESYTHAIHALAVAEQQRRALRLFEKRLLENLGLLADYSQIGQTGIAVEAGRVYHVREGLGVVADVTDQSPRLGPRTIRGEHLLSLASEQIDDPDCVEAIRMLLAECINQALDGRVLKTREVAHAVRAFERTVKETARE
jgi:DNA repair protein RecO (recombination protein O)